MPAESLILLLKLSIIIHSNKLLVNANGVPPKPPYPSNIPLHPPTLQKRSQPKHCYPVNQLSTTRQHPTLLPAAKYQATNQIQHKPINRDLEEDKVAASWSSTNDSLWSVTMLTAGSSSLKIAPPSVEWPGWSIITLCAVLGCLVGS